jgi:hypothetical protein
MMGGRQWYYREEMPRHDKVTEQVLPRTFGNPGFIKGRHFGQDFESGLDQSDGEACTGSLSQAKIQIK